MPIYDFTNKGEITVKVKKNKRVETDIFRRPKGVIKTRKTIDYLPRRLPGYIKFFDAGQKLSEGVWSDFSFYITDTFSASNSSGFPTRRAATMADYDALKEAIVGDFENARQIYKADDEVFNLRVRVDGGSEIDFKTSNKFSDQGLKLTAAELAGDLISIKTNASHFEFIINIGVGGDKITALPDYSETAITDFKLKSGDGVILVPALVGVDARSFMSVDGAPANERRNHWYLQYFTILPRKTVIDPDSPNYHYEYSGGWQSSIGDAEDYQEVWEALQIMKTLDHQRAWRFDGVTATGGTWTEVSGSEYLPPAFPAPPGYPGSDGSYTPLEAGAGYDGLGITPSGVLKAIIKRRSDFYYVWS